MVRYLNLAKATAFVVVATILTVGFNIACTSSKPTKSPSTTAPTSKPTAFSGYIRSPATNVSSVTLPEVGGSSVNMVAPADGLKLVYFGFTSCPDVCPTTLSHVKKALAEQSSADRLRVQVDVVTIDPIRDTPEKLTEYVSQFVPSANAIRTEDFVLLRSATDKFGADFSSRLNDKGVREVSHTADLYAIDDTGTIVLAWPFGTNPADLERDINRLLAGERPAEIVSDDSTQPPPREE